MPGDSDEEILERAFLSALRKHFPKAGPWQILKFSQNQKYVVPKGQIQEIYVIMPAGTYEVFLGSKLLDGPFPSGLPIAKGLNFTPALMLPQYFRQSWRNQLLSNIDPVSGDVTYAAATQTELNFSASSEGWILGEDEYVYVAEATGMVVRWRRRFDLEI